MNLVLDFLIRAQRFILSHKELELRLRIAVTL